jgi:DNA-binding beta-propeller fold protein YncE
MGTFSTNGAAPNNLVFDGNNIWVTNEFDQSVAQISAATGSLVFFFRGGTDQPSGIAFDGVNVWVSNFGDLTVSRF